VWLRCASQQIKSVGFRSGSQTGIATLPFNVRFTPESGHWNSAAECPLLACASGITQQKKLFGSVLGEDALQRAPMHVEAPGGFRNVAVA
jgi:hypothetical protein